jgi:hypothetical protein
VAVIDYPAILFTSDRVSSPFVDVLTEDDDLRIQPLRRYRSGAFRTFLVVDKQGNRLEGDTLGIERLAPEMLFRFGLRIGVIGVIGSFLTLDPYVLLKMRLAAAGSESFEDTKKRIFRYFRLNPEHYTWAGVKALRARVARAKNVEEIVKRFVVD